MISSIAIAMTIGLAQAPAKVTFQSVATKRPGFYSAGTKSPVFSGSPLATYATQRVKEIATASLASWMKENATDWKSKPRLEYYYQANPTVSLVTPEVISMYWQVDTFAAGAHGMSIYDPHTFAYVNGQPTEIHAKDIFNGSIDYASAVSSLIISKLMMNDRAEWVQNGEVKSLTAAQIDSFVVTPAGLTYLFNPYDMGPYAVGTFQVKVPFSEIKADLAPNNPLQSLINR